MALMNVSAGQEQRRRCGGAGVDTWASEKKRVGQTERAARWA